MKTKKTASASEWTTGLRLLGFMSVFRAGAYSASARTSLPTLLWTTYNGNGGTVECEDIGSADVGEALDVKLTYHLYLDLSY